MNKSIIITVLCILLSEITRIPLYSSSIKIIRKRQSTVIFRSSAIDIKKKVATRAIESVLYLFVCGGYPWIKCI